MEMTPTVIEMFIPLVLLGMWASIIPGWVISSKVGKSGAWSLIILFPILGMMIFLAMLAFGKWPAIEGEAA